MKHVNLVRSSPHALRVSNVSPPPPPDTILLPVRASTSSNVFFVYVPFRVTLVGLRGEAHGG